jgi:hypothetical protein
LLIRERDGQREGFPWTHGKITRESPPGTLSLEWARVVCNGALQGKRRKGRIVQRIEASQERAYSRSELNEGARV